ncbi:class I SAM-dependent methyltransferase [Nocardia sp. NPDC005978]|uniref:class I SAM-dependent methyltransferase n=1 Tax=Nocardia sp. NPDC005978 TaxID=3156725 RepID=UPI0033B15F7D
MGMNYFHQLGCRSTLWERASTTTLVPWALSGLDLGDRTLEIGPGYGANIAALRTRTAALSGLEIDAALAARLRARHPGRLAVIDGDGTAMPLPDNDFSAVVAFTMFHHVPTPARQDDLFAEAFRVLRPGGVFAGIDGRDTLPFRLMHVGDVCVPVPPATLPARLKSAGFTDVEVRSNPTMFRFRARRP